ncbi:mannose-1-phosphate guanylyltransferase [Dactylococcopsis salina]|uniref:mannose-1-phosphate guanylyltransferase n=1 Tax=Dactylococcopsis salina (strain PCC 8305) TaxID=13035 RepID=K9YSG1_DACS8|nr:mannose-1-phosphate guanylyltransferase [Dactylococcopsis salina]AFZ49819.1 mannose-1-phosphate guanylyltransferase [Dactylococcopsis salina PCC 8305]
MTISIIPVILAGGKGERFWPVSRRERPKQFLSLDGSGNTLLQATANRLLNLASGWEKIWVITSEMLASGVQEQLPELPPENCLVEPQGRDTAPAVAWATIEIAKRYGEDAVIGFFPADHWIGNTVKFEATIEAAFDLALSEEVIVTLGMKPTYPSTGYGYIEQGEKIRDNHDISAYSVTRFTEKPDHDTAESFIATERFSWNSGMFIFRAGVVLKELKQYAPDILTPLQEKGKVAYADLPKNSIDYALMEKTQLATVIPTEFGWDDLGDWNALERLFKGDNENVEMGTHLGLDTKGTIVYSSDSEQVVVTLGLEDVVIVRDRNVTLVVKKDRTQDIKKLLKELQADDRFDKFL